MNTIVSESGIYIEQMDINLFTRQLINCRMDPNPCMCVYIPFSITHYQITTAYTEWCKLLIVLKWQLNYIIGYFVVFNSNQFVGCFITFCDPKNIYLDINIV